MHKVLSKYLITPRILEADKEQVITVEGLDDSNRFIDEVDYIVKITKKDGWEYKEGAAPLGGNGRNCTEEFKVRSKNGVIKFSYFFGGETEWKINIARADLSSHVPEKIEKYGWKGFEKLLLEGFFFHCYSLYPDLYKKRVYKGDLHTHSYGSDGRHSPAMTSAQFRKWGYDFISLTDHYTLKPSFEAIKTLSEIDTAFKVFPGEEVHPYLNGVMHVVNFNPKSSVNDLAYAAPEKTFSEVKEISKTLEIPDEEKRIEFAWFKWIYENIKKSGGIAIYSHPYWISRDSYNVNEETSIAICREGLTDVFEMYGGAEEKDNCMQANLYYHISKMGYDYPIVGSSDAHDCLEHGIRHFDNAYTYVFAESADNIPESILSGYSVAVLNFNPENINISGDLRLTKYAWFLKENYFDPRGDLCNASGQAMLRYVLGDKTQKKLIKLLEEEIEKFNINFYGNRNF